MPMSQRQALYAKAPLHQPTFGLGTRKRQRGSEASPRLVMATELGEENAACCLAVGIAFGRRQGRETGCR